MTALEKEIKAYKERYSVTVTLKQGETQPSTSLANHLKYCILLFLSLSWQLTRKMFHSIVWAKDFFIFQHTKVHIKYFEKTLLTSFQKQLFAKPALFYNADCFSLSKYTFFFIHLSFLYCGVQNYMQFSKRGCKVQSLPSTSQQLAGA